MSRHPFRKSPNAPRDVIEQAHLTKGERALASAPTSDGTWLLGTRDSLLIIDSGHAPAEPSRVPWQRIETADWDRDSQQLRIVEVGEFGQVRPQYTFTIADPRLMLELIRERVTASVVLQRRFAVSGKKGLRVVARRAPRGEGAIAWTYEFDEGVDPDDPLVLETARRGLESAAEELGL